MNKVKVSGAFMDAISVMAAGGIILSIAMGCVTTSIILDGICVGAILINSVSYSYIYFNTIVE